jgi:hypothetical protein
MQSTKWIWICLVAVSMAYCDEDASLVADAGSEVAWGFRSKEEAAPPPVAIISTSHESEKHPAKKNPGPYNNITGKGGWFFGEYLYWRPSNSELPFGLESTTIASADTDGNLITGNVERHIPYKMRSGFRVGLGCRLSSDQWDLAGQWTQFGAHGHKTIYNAGGPQHVTPIWEPIIGSNPWKIGAKSDLHLKMVDIEIGKIFCPSQSFSLRPSIGTRWVSVDQRMRLHYEGLSMTIQSSYHIFGQDQIHTKNEYQGMGLRGAASANWNFRTGFALYGKAGYSLVYGSFKSSLREQFTGYNTFTSNSPVNVSTKGKNDFHATRNIFDATAGISWTKVFSHTKRLSFNLAYEFTFLPNQGNQSVLFPTGTSMLKTDLGFQGLTAGGRFDF